MPIHVIGGIATMSSDAETLGFVHAVREDGVIGASFYTEPGVSGTEWSELGDIAANPVETPSLPVTPRVAAYGNIPGGDTTHPKEVVYRAGGQPGSWALSFQGYDVTDGEVSVYVNWRLIGTLDVTAGGAWGVTQTMPIPAAWWQNSDKNYVAFVALGDEPSWSTWGVRHVSVDPSAPSPTPDPSGTLAASAT